MLLIYPVQPPDKVPKRDGRPEEETGLSRNGTPLIGVALSFPTSDTTLGSEYRVNRVWKTEMEEDERYDDDD